MKGQLFQDLQQTFIEKTAVISTSLKSIKHNLIFTTNKKQSNKLIIVIVVVYINYFYIIFLRMRFSIFTFYLHSIVPLDLKMYLMQPPYRVPPLHNLSQCHPKHLLISHTHSPINHNSLHIPTILPFFAFLYATFDIFIAITQFT